MLSSVLKRLASITLCITVIFCLFSVDAFAEQEIISVNLSTQTRLAAAPVAQNSSDDALIESITKQIKNCNEVIDISRFKLGYSNENMQKIVNILSYEIPEAFNFNTDFSVLYNQTNFIIVGIKPKYVYEKAEYQAMLGECEEVANKMLEGIIDNDSLGTKEKLLLLHDKIDLWCEYDNSGIIPYISHSMYGAFINKVAVCQGYTLAYKFLLNKLGVQSYACASNGLNHVWNIVYLNGEKYHVDLTWDDILPDTYGQSLHENFLVSTNKLIQNGHYFVEEDGYAYIDYDNSPTSTTYDDYFWQDVNTAFVLLNGEIYYTDRELIIGNNGATQYILIKSYSDNRILFKKEDYWFANLNGSFYDENYARLTTDGTNLLFSLSDSIYSLNPETLEAKTLVTKPASFNKTFSIYGFKYSNSTLYYQISNSPAFKNLFTYTATYYSPTQLKAGNINLDEEGVVDLIDVTTLARALAGWKVECNENGFDVNGDGNANLFDLVHLAQYVAGWKSVVIH